MYYIGLQIARCVGAIFRGKDMPGHAKDTAMSCAKMADPIETSFGLSIWVGPRKHVLNGVHVGATWQIRLNRQCSVALQK